MVCWICGAANLTGEHIPKASILRGLFGSANSSSPLIFNGKHYRNKKLQSINSSYLKYKQICANCNNSLTQKHDEVWDNFFDFLQDNKESIRVGSKLSKAKIFGYNAKKKEVYLQLYLLKIFSTFCVAHNVLIDFQGIARSIRNSIPYKNFYLGIAKRSWLTKLKLVAGSPIHIEKNQRTGKVEIAIQIMIIDGWEFELIYVDPNYQIKNFPRCWNPLISKEFFVKSFHKKVF
jgi:hypothetical protein